MKIQDIIVEDQQVLDEFSTMARGIRKALEKKGYEALGAGVDQEAYLEPDGKTVLKIFGTQGNTKNSVPTKRCLPSGQIFVNAIQTTLSCPSFQVGRLSTTKVNCICKFALSF